MPARYERLHLLALFAGVSLLALAVAGGDDDDAHDVQVSDVAARPASQVGRRRFDQPELMLRLAVVITLIPILVAPDPVAGARVDPDR